MPQVNILDTEILSDQKTTLKAITYEVIKEGSSSGSQTREVLDHGNAATCLLYNPAEKKVLLTRQVRIATFVNGNASGLLLEAAAGILEEGEAPTATMIREIKEETGYEIAELRKVYEAYSSPGAYAEKLHFFVAEYWSSQKVAEGGGLKEEGEDIGLVELSYTEARQLLEQGKIEDAKTIILLQYALLHGLLA